MRSALLTAPHRTHETQSYMGMCGSRIFSKPWWSCTQCMRVASNYNQAQSNSPFSAPAGPLGPRKVVLRVWGPGRRLRASLRAEWKLGVRFLSRTVPAPSLSRGGGTVAWLLA